MATYTTNLNLKKPTTSENYNVLDWNNNSDKIDTAYGTLNSQLLAKFRTSHITSISDLTSYITTQKIGIARVDATLGSSLGNASRQGIVLGYEISSDYDAFLFLDSNGDTYSGWITVATGDVTKTKL